MGSTERAFPEDGRITVSLSGGGYRAALFSAGAMLALADSSARKDIASVSSVSGGSITAAVTIGGFTDPTADDPDPMGARVGLIAGLAQTDFIDTQAFLAGNKLFLWLIGIGLAIMFIVPTWDVGQKDPDVVTQPVFVGRIVTVLIALFVVLAAGRILHAFQTSLYSVQSVVENLVSTALGAEDSTRGTTLADIDGVEHTRRIFCATDLSLGSHIYLTPGRVLSAGAVGVDPHVFLADVVAASACFPGFRPIVFTRAELGLQGSPRPGAPRVHRAGARLLIGAAGFVGLAGVVVAVILRMLAPYNGEVIDPWLPIVLVVAGALVVVVSARILTLRERVVLVDGGVCDNLGAAFTLLAEDERYPDLHTIAGTDAGGAMLVVDASKPFSELDVASRSMVSLLPLRIRGAQRSVLQLMGNANSVARKQAIQLLLQRGIPFVGDVISIQDAPESAGEAGAHLAARNAATPTTLAALERDTVRRLLLQSYRLTQEHLERRGVASLRRRTDADFDALVDAEVVTRVAASMAKPPGPYGRTKRRTSWIVNLSVVVGGALVFVLITTLMGIP